MFCPFLSGRPGISNAIPVFVWVIYIFLLSGCMRRMLLTLLKAPLVPMWAKHAHPKFYIILSQWLVQNMPPREWIAGLRWDYSKRGTLIPLRLLSMQDASVELLVCTSVQREQQAWGWAHWRGKQGWNQETEYGTRGHGSFGHLRVGWTKLTNMTIRKWYKIEHNQWPK